MITKLTLAIVTRKRPIKLQRCLVSITKQTLVPGRILVVDNDRGGSGHPVAEQFKSQLPLVYVLEKIQNVPLARNKALSLCQTPFLGFVDDDCVLDQHWVKNGLAALNKNSKTAYVQGRSLLFNTKSLVAQALFTRQNYWFNYKLDKKTLTTTPYNLDTKNVIFRLNILKQNHIRFDKRLYLATVGDHADMDVGFRLDQLGFSGIFEPTMLVCHEEVQAFTDFFKKAYERGRVGFLLYHKWNLSKELVYLPDIKLSKWIRRLKCWPRDYRLWTRNVRGPVFSKALIFLLIKLYDRVYLQGFVAQAQKIGVRLNFQERTDL